MKSALDEACTNVATQVASRLRSSDDLTRPWAGAAEMRNSTPTRAKSGLDGAAAAALLQSAVGEALEDGSLFHVSRRLATIATRHASTDASLVAGWTGIGLSLGLLNERVGNFEDAVSAIRAKISSLVEQELCEREFSLRSSHQFELLKGFSGHLLLLSTAECEAAREAIIAAFDDMTLDGTGASWRLPNAYDQFQNESLNLLGVSHGIAGVLGSLLMTQSSPRVRAIATRIGDFLCDAARVNEHGAFWPYDLSASQNGMTSVFPRAAWCHFAPGITATLWAAGEMLGVERFTKTAISSVRAIAKLPVEQWRMTDHGFCHGVAGNAVLFDYLANCTQDAKLTEISTSLTSSLVAGYRSESTFGYKTLLLGRRVDDPGLFSGASGIALSLLTLSRQIDDSWLALFGIPPRQIISDAVSRRNKETSTRVTAKFAAPAVTAR